MLCLKKPFRRRGKVMAGFSSPNSYLEDLAEKSDVPTFPAMWENAAKKLSES